MKFGSFGLNQNGGIWKEEIEKHLFPNITRLHTDIAGVKGQWVLIKIYGGPGCNSSLLMCDLLCNLRIYLYPGVPKSLSVSYFF